MSSIHYVQKSLLVLLLCCLLVIPLQAQDTPAPEPTDEAGLSFGLSASAALDSSTPRIVYTFDGLRGEFISISLRVTSGTLDPVLLVLDSGGAVLAQHDDTANGRDIVIESLRIPESGRYFIVVGRFGYALGTTSGGFDLQLERIGVSFSDGSGLRYGDTVLNEITDTAPRFYYTFRAERGDIITISMERTSGDLDPTLQLVNSSGIVIAENDEIEGSGSLDAAIVGYTIEEDGIYVIIATRYGQVAGRSSGSFLLTLQTGAQSGLGASAQFALALLPDQPIEGELTADRFEAFYRFEGQESDIVTIEMSRVGGGLDTFLRLLDDQGNVLASDDDGGGGQNSAIRNFVLPYTGSYTVVATRFQEAAGTTTGAYTLTLRVQGNAFDGVPADMQRLTYGSTATGTLDDLVPRLIYAFYGTAGDTITISMTSVSGDLDPVIGLLNANQQLLVVDDDSGGARNALIERFTLPETGVYYIQAARYEGADRPPSSGAFLLVLAQRFD
ncbi:MAG: PPC domain-containing protein [Chloroflexota bacterium]|nr:PPC domain-containing protein [Chloroflexota bacterium]